MRRREFVTLVGGAAAGWPLAAHAQQERVRGIGVLMDFAAGDPEGEARLVAFKRGLAELGWVADRNVRIDPRWAATDVDRVRKYRCGFGHAHAGPHPGRWRNGCAFGH